MLWEEQDRTGGIGDNIVFPFDQLSTPPRNVTSNVRRQPDCRVPWRQGARPGDDFGPGEGRGEVSLIVVQLAPFSLPCLPASSPLPRI